ncbi:peptidyl-prolyl cis-trans isomerase, partial [Ralstonia pseudosolanacearum]
MNVSIRRTVLAALALAAFTALPAQADTLPPGVIAIVNGTRITQDQLDRAIAQSGAQAN